LIGIIAGVFLAGIGTGYGILQSSTNVTTPMMMNSQQMQQMMNDPQQMNQWMNSMMQNPDTMNQWMGNMMNDPQAMQQMHDMMMSNPQHMNQMMGPMMDTMMNNPDMQQQMMNHMMNNQGMMNSMMNNQDMMNMMGNNMMMGGMMMDGNMMGQQIQGQNKSTQTETTSYVKMVDGVQVVTINAEEFKFTPSELNISAGKTKFVLINDGAGEHELVVYEASKQDILIQAEIDEDEETIEQNILFEIEEVHGRESGESEVMDLTKGSYVIGCLIPGHYDAGMKGTLEIES